MEALVVIPFFILTFAALVFVGRMYTEKSRVMRSTKERAWTAALASCPGGASTDEGAPGLGTEGVDTRESGYANGAPGADTITRSFGSVAVHVEGNVSVTGPLAIGKTMKSTTRVMCNEEARDGNLLGVLKTAWGSVTGW